MMLDVILDFRRSTKEIGGIIPFLEASYHHKPPLPGDHVLIRLPEEHGSCIYKLTRPAGNNNYLDYVFFFFFLLFFSFYSYFYIF